MSEENAAAESTNAAESEAQNPADKLYDSKPEGDAATEEKPAEGDSSEEQKPEGGDGQSDDKSDDSSDAEESEGSDKESDDKDEESSEDKKESKAPETYELATDDDSPVTDEDLDKIAQYSKERGLSNDDAQKVVDMVEEGIKGYQSKLLTDLESTSETWKAEAMKDKEIGGDALGENIQMGKSLIDQFGDDELKADLVDTGYANKASVIRFLSRLGKAGNFSNDQFITGGKEAQKPASMADKFYPSTANT